MAAILRRLQSYTGAFPAAWAEDGVTWVFDQKLVEQPCEFFRPLLRSHLVFQLEYEVLCTEIAASIQSTADIKKQKDQLIAALMLAEILQYHYRHFYNVPREVLRMQAECQRLQSLLGSQGYIFPSPSAVLSGYRISQSIREGTVNWNIIRVATQRTRRFLVATGAALSVEDFLPQSLLTIDHVARPLINYLVWLYFIPRLLNNFCMLGKHCIPGPWMEAREQALGWQDRLRIQLLRRGFELVDDICWFFVNMSICLFCTGPMLPYALFVSIFQQTFEVCMRIIKMVAKLIPLINVRQEYKDLLKAETLDELAKEEVHHYLSHLDARIRHEAIALCLDVSNSVVLMLSIILAIPLFAVNPLMPLAGALLALSATGVFFVLNKWLNQYKPTQPLPGLAELEKSPGSVSQHGFFAKRLETKTLPADVHLEPDTANVY